jgi:tetratricopeptide (TPR) repeat protein
LVDFRALAFASLGVRHKMPELQPSKWMNWGMILLMAALNLAGSESSKNGTGDFAGYIGQESCRGCHPVEYERWSESAHGLAERPLRTATDQIAFAPPRSIKHGADVTTVGTNGNEFQIVTLGLESNLQPFRVERVIGNSPLIQFLTPFPGGRYQVHEASFDPKSNQWFYVYSDDFRNPGEYGHWTGRGMNWNSQCAECHNTRLKKNYEAATDSYHTTMAGMSVNCEACHGPLQKHLDWQRAHPKSITHDPTVTPLSPARTIGMCGSCHSRNTDLTGDFVPGDSFYDHYTLEILDNSQRWYPDGQVKDEDYEFASFLGSKMYQAGVTCLDCHTRDVTKPQLHGNDLCMKCHNGGYPKAPVIDAAGHGHHKLIDKGSECIGCHMPITVYMQRHPRHDHGFTIPDPLLTKDLNIPNACNRCHADKTTDWAVKYADEWYGTNMNRPSRERTRWIAAAEIGKAGDKLIGLLADMNQSPYWRAVAAAFLQQWADEPATKSALLAQLKNEHPLVRERAVRSLEPVSADTNVLAALNPMLNDPVRNVRVATAWVLRATVDLQSQAGSDLQRMLDLEADQPTGQFEAAMFSLSRQQPAEALVHLKKATAWDPISPPFLCTQAQVQDQLGQLPEALKTLDQAEAAVPDDPHIPYVRAVILKRNGRNDEAKTAVTRALKVQADFQPAIQLLQKLL